MAFIFATDDRAPGADPVQIPEHWLDVPELGAHFSRFEEIPQTRQTAAPVATKAADKKE